METLEEILEKLFSSNHSEVELALKSLIHSKALYDGTLVGKQLPFVKLKDFNLSNALLRDTDLQGSDFRNTDFSNANLIGVNFENADLRGANLSDTLMQSVNLKHTKLDNAKLQGAKLDGARLEYTDLQEADLRTAELFNAKLINVNLSSSNLQNTMLYGTHLDSVDFWNANLTEASMAKTIVLNCDFRSAVLSKTKLQHAKFFNCLLSDCIFDGAVCGFTTFNDIDLSEVHGLDKIEHQFPSSIGIDTIYKSKGLISKKFLIGVGIPQEFVNSMDTLTQDIRAYYSCFISYSTEDIEFTDYFVEKLQEKGLHLFYAKRSMKGGEDFPKQIESAIEQFDKTIVILSNHSMNSDWVKRELYLAARKEKRNKQKVLFPIRIINMKDIQQWEYFDVDTVQDIAAKIRRFHIPDFTEWQVEDKFDKEFARILDGLKRSTPS